MSNSTGKASKDTPRSKKKKQRTLTFNIVINSRLLKDVMRVKKLVGKEAKLVNEYGTLGCRYYMEYETEV